MVKGNVLAGDVVGTASKWNRRSVTVKMLVDTREKFRFHFLESRIR